MPDADHHQRQYGPDQQAIPQAAQSPRPAAAPGRLFEGRLDDLQFAHSLDQTCRTRAPLASLKALDMATAKKFLANRVSSRRLRPGDGRGPGTSTGPPRLGVACGGKSSVHPGSLCLAGTRIELPAPGRLGAVSAQQKVCNVLRSAESIMIRRGMLPETGDGTAGGRAAGIGGKEGKTTEFLRSSTVTPS